MGCVDDPPDRLLVEIAAQRAAALSRAAESATLRGRAQLPLYVIGTDAPAPGRALRENGSITVADPQVLRAELAHYEKAFRLAGLDGGYLGAYL